MLPTFSQSQQLNQSHMKPLSLRLCQQQATQWRISMLERAIRIINKGQYHCAAVIESSLRAVKTFRWHFYTATFAAHFDRYRLHRFCHLPFHFKRALRFQSLLLLPTFKTRRGDFQRALLFGKIYYRRESTIIALSLRFTFRFFCYCFLTSWPSTELFEDFSLVCCLAIRQPFLKENFAEAWPGIALAFASKTALFGAIVDDSTYGYRHLPVPAIFRQHLKEYLESNVCILKQRAAGKHPIQRKFPRRLDDICLICSM